MKPFYEEALAGTLKSDPPGDKEWTLSLFSLLDIATKAYYADENGDLLPLGFTFIGPKSKLVAPTKMSKTRSYLVIKHTIGGAFVCVIPITVQSESYTFDSAMLSKPNDIGPLPIPTQDLLIPRDSQPVVVGCGVAMERVIVREQSWQKMGDSYTLAPHETRTVGSTSSSGMTETSSSEETTSLSLSMDVSVGWGPISSSISSALNSTSTTLQSYTINKQETSYESSVITNAEAYPVMNLRWQMSDVITILDVFATKPLASVVSRVPPSIVKSYNMTTLHNTPKDTGYSLKRNEQLIEEWRLLNEVK
jgi:hypothetical protein